MNSRSMTLDRRDDSRHDGGTARAEQVLIVTGREPRLNTKRQAARVSSEHVVFRIQNRISWTGRGANGARLYHPTATVRIDTLTTEGDSDDRNRRADVQ